MNAHITFLFFLCCSLCFSQIEENKELENIEGKFDLEQNLSKETEEILRELQEKKSNINGNKNLLFKFDNYKTDKIDEQQLYKNRIKSLQEVQEIQQDQKTKREQKFFTIESTQDSFETNQEISKGLTVTSATSSSTDNFEDYFDSKRLYGPSQYDSRVEVRQLNPDIDWQWLILRRNLSVGMVVLKNKIHLISEDFYQLDVSLDLGSVYNLCDDVAFKKQAVVGVGTSFIIGEQQMMTANHVFQGKEEDYAIVFGYELVNKNGIVETLIPKKDIYFPKKIIEQSNEYDLAIFETDRPLERPILKFKSSFSLKKGDEIYMIGHPTGLPKKIAVNASVVDNSHYQYFYTSLDSFQGNSGSPVFDFETHKVIGVLVSGALDFVFNGTCNEINLCTIPYCKGEKVMRIENIIDESKL